MRVSPAFYCCTIERDLLRPLHLQSNKTTCAQPLRRSTCYTRIYKFTQHVAALSFPSEVACPEMSGSAPNHRVSGLELLSRPNDTSYVHDAGGASTFPVRHGDAASVAELKGVRVPQMKA